MSVSLACRLTRASVLAAAVALSGCGRRGELEAPPNAAAVQAPAKDDLGLRKTNPPITPPKKAFVLDPLLQ